MTNPNPNWFTGNPLDRATLQRAHPEWLERQLAHPQAKMLSFWHDRPLITEAASNDKAHAPLTPVWLSPTARQEYPPEVPLILLGLKQGIPYFAIDATTASDSAETSPFTDLGTYTAIRDIAHKIDPILATIMGHALWLLAWHRTHQYCPKTGRKTEMAHGGAKRVEPLSQTEHFPRVNPVAIVLPIFEDQCLLARSPHFFANMYSAPAGYMEPGETLEECAAREIFEETGLRLSSIEYQFSQPWPFSASLMTGFLATATTQELTLDHQEIEEARWLTRAEIQALLAGQRRPDLWIPPPFAIAHQLLRKWALS
ncbi:MAG: NAD(+) diphosphatase [bacterium]